MEKTKKISIFITVVLIAAFVLIIGIYAFRQRKTDNVNNNQTVQNPVVNLSVDDKAILDEFVSCQKGYDPNSNPENRNDPNGLFYFMAKAIADKDPQRCDNLADGQDKNQCLKTLDIIASIGSGDDRYCTELGKINPDDGVVCEAMVKKDISLCSIKDAFKNHLCLAAAARNDNVCQELTGSYGSKGSCLSTDGNRNSQNFGVEESCGQINANDAQSLCKESVAFVKAIEDKNYDECAKIDSNSGSFTKFFCQVAIKDDGNAELNKIYADNACYEKYASKMAKIKNDPSICENIPEKDGQNKDNYQQCKNQFQ